MNNAELVTAFEAGTIASADFRHQDHVHVCWGLVQHYGRDEGFKRLTAGIKTMAARAGRPQAYHVTITKAWFDLIATVENLDDASELLDKSIINRYYSPARLAEGRERWVEPDLHPLRLPFPPPPVDVIDFRGALRRLPTAVGVLAARAGELVHATTVSSITSVSLDPAIISVCLANSSRALEVVREAHAFALSILASDQAALADRFAARDRPSGTAQFALVRHQSGPFGPVIEDSVAWLGCRLHAVHPCGDHHIVLGEVKSAHLPSEEHPLVRHAGTYHSTDAGAA